jgi:geranylgeranyl transferase type-2 subunit alpha
VPGWALEQEFDLVEQASFTDPEDQSAWLYHRWLLAQAPRPALPLMPVSER